MYMSFIQPALCLWQGMPSTYYFFFSTVNVFTAVALPYCM